jgi:hypothetical protein
MRTLKKNCQALALFDKQKQFGTILVYIIKTVTTAVTTSALSVLRRFM